MEQLRSDSRVESPDVTDLHRAWSSWINEAPVTSKEPQGNVIGESVVEGGAHPVRAAVTRAVPLVPSTYPLLGGLAIGLGLGWLLARRSSAALRGAIHPERDPDSSEHRPGEVSLIAHHVLKDRGVVLEVDIEGQRLLLSVGGDRQSAAILTRPGAREDGDVSTGSESGARVDVEAYWNNASLSGAERLERAQVVDVGRVKSADLPTTRSIGDKLLIPNGNMNSRLGELLGKVRGRKILAKRADEV